MNKLALLTAAVSLAGCSSIIEGTSQTLTVMTNPDGANCALMREGLNIGRINPTPGSVVVKKDKHDIFVECEMAGYQKATFFNKSDVAGATAGNIILGGGIGWAIDSAAGADNKYLSPVQITLVPIIPQAPTPTPAVAPAAKEVKPGTSS